MLKDTLIEALKEIWPMLIIFSVIFLSVRITYLLCHRQKLAIYKEFYMLTFIIYILILFYVVTFQDNSLGSSNFTPFKELFRYSFGSRLFLKNVIGNMLLFVPFGLFVSYYLKNHRMFPIFILTLISSLSIEFTQSKIGRVFDIDDILLNVIGGVVGYLLFVSLDAINKHLPKIFRSEVLKNIFVIIILVLIVLYFIKFEPALFSYILCIG